MNSYLSTLARHGSKRYRKRTGIIAIGLDMARYVLGLPLSVRYDRRCDLSAVRHLHPWHASDRHVFLLTRQATTYFWALIKNHLGDRNFQPADQIQTATLCPCRSHPCCPLFSAFDLQAFVPIFAIVVTTTLSVFAVCASFTITLPGSACWPRPSAPLCRGRPL